jgi:CO dehydrogenase maturation factor
MADVIAVTGKGGVGKTTVAALVVRALVEAGKGAVLAVDADPNLNLDTALGVEATETVGDVREAGLDRTAELPGGMAKAQFLELRIQQALVEAEGFDLLAMGRPEGPGCYCFANSILRACVDQLGKQYRYVVVDCEAGLEHLSRRTAGDVEALILLSDPSVRSLDTVKRVLELVEELGTKVGKTAFAFTRVADGIPEVLKAAAKERELPEPLAIPEDPELRELDVNGRALTDVSEDSPAYQAVKAVLREVGVLESE